MEDVESEAVLVFGGVPAGEPGARMMEAGELAAGNLNVSGARPIVKGRSFVPKIEQLRGCNERLDGNLNVCGNKANMHAFSTADHSFNMGSGSSSSFRQNLLSSTLTGVCISSDCLNDQERLKVQNSVPLGSMDLSHAAALKMKGLGKGGNTEPSRSKNAHLPANVWSRPAVVTLPKINNSENFLINENTVRLDEEALHANYKKFEGALRLFGKPLAFFHLIAELKRQWDQFGSSAW